MNSALQFLNLQNLHIKEKKMINVFIKALQKWSLSKKGSMSSHVMTSQKQHNLASYVRMQWTQQVSN